MRSQFQADEQFEIRLLGVDCAHVPNWGTIKSTTTGKKHEMLPDDSAVELGSGMLAVIPAWKLLELLNREDLKSMREDKSDRDSWLIEEAATESQTTTLEQTEGLLGNLFGVPKDEADEVHRNHQS